MLGLVLGLEFEIEELGLGLRLGLGLGVREYRILKGNQRIVKQMCVCVCA